MVMEEFPRQDWCAEEVDWEKMVLGVRTRCRDREGFTRWLKKWHLGFYAKQ